MALQVSRIKEIITLEINVVKMLLKKRKHLNTVEKIVSFVERMPLERSGRCVR